MISVQQVVGVGPILRNQRPKATAKRPHLSGYYSAEVGYSLEMAQPKTGIRQRNLGSRLEVRPALPMRQDSCPGEGILVGSVAMRYSQEQN